MKLVLYLLVEVALFHKNNGSWITLEEKYGLSGPLTFLDGDEYGVNCRGITETICSEDVAKCDSIFLCIDGRPNPLEGKCIPGYSCSAGECSEIPSTLCEYRHMKFKCNMEGMYPEPSSCKKYNYCVPPGNATAIQGECPTGWAYNPANTLCDIMLPNNSCADSDRVVPTCRSVLQNGAVDMNPALYYICFRYSEDDFTLYPNIFKCPGNTKYVGDFICE